MGFALRLAGQLASPHGFAGRLLGGGMDLVNRLPCRLAHDLLDPQDGEHILDAGCGTGAALAALKRRANVRLSGVDLSATMILAARRRLRTYAELHTASIEALPFPPGTFDAVTLLNVLYFADPAGRMVAHLHAALKPGGRLVAYVTHQETMERWSFAHAGFHRLFDAAQLVDTLRQGGFVAERIYVQEVPITRSVKGLLAKAIR